MTSGTESSPDRADAFLGYEPVGEGRTFHIGELASIVGLSVRTIRHYDELGIVVPSARTAGGFRLYTDADARRFLFVKKLKPLGFTLEEVQELVDCLDRLSASEVAEVGLLERLEQYAAMVDQRCETLRRELDDAEVVATGIRGRIRAVAPEILG